MTVGDRPLETPEDRRNSREKKGHVFAGFAVFFAFNNIVARKVRFTVAGDSPRMLPVQTKSKQINETSYFKENRSFSK